MTPRQTEGGFTLIEALVALGIVATIVISYIGIRTTALIDATQARNWRLAREIAEEKMSELQAGAREVPPTSGETVKLPDYEGFEFKIAIGESEVADIEAEVGAAAAGNSEEANERVDWQRDREDYRRAQSRGLSAADYQDKREEDVATRLAEKAPSATEFEEIAVVVYFPKLDPEYPGQKDALLVKARMSTLALSGLTPEQAAAIAVSKGQTPESGAGGSGNPATGGGAANPGGASNVGGGAEGK